MKFRPDLILLGASTGGTDALNKLLTNFPTRSPPVLIVQHIPANFAKAFAERLISNSGLKLGEMRSGALLKEGHIYISLEDAHIGVKKHGGEYQLELSYSPPMNRHRPSVEYLFQSCLPFANKVAATILTGMGNDGAQSLAELKKRGGITFAQSEESCVVFGMPKEAIKLGGAGFIGDLRAIRSEHDTLIHYNK